jgi:hypothetical protein
MASSPSRRTGRSLSRPLSSTFEAIESDFEDRKYRHQESGDPGHGRTDERVYDLARVPKDFACAKDWPE